MTNCTLARYCKDLWDSAEFWDTWKRKYNAIPFNLWKNLTFILLFEAREHLSVAFKLKQFLPSISIYNIVKIKVEAKNSIYMLKSIGREVNPVGAKNSRKCYRSTVMDQFWFSLILALIFYVSWFYFLAKP